MTWVGCHLHTAGRKDRVIRDAFNPYFQPVSMRLTADGGRDLLDDGKVPQIEPWQQQDA